MPVPDCFYTAVHQRILNEMILPCRKGDDWYGVLALDNRTLPLVNAACRMDEIYDAGITLVENMSYRRPPLPEMDVVYFIDPSEDTADRLVEAWSNPPDQYADVHLFFTRSVSTFVMNKIKQCPNLLKKVKTFNEVHMDFVVLERRLVSLGMPDAIQDLWISGLRSDKQRTEYEITARLLSLLVSLGQFPYIRYAKAGVSGVEVSPTIANMLNDEMTRLAGTNPTFRSSLASGAESRGTLLILDRSQDPLTPLLHEATYQAMVEDQLASAASVNDTVTDGLGPLKPAKGSDPLPPGPYELAHHQEYAYQSERGGKMQTTTVMLDERDVVWEEFRHVNMGDCINQITNNFAAFKKENAHMEGGSQQQKMKKLGATLQNFPLYTKQKDSYSMHVDMLYKLSDLFNAEQFHLQQTLATGEDDSGRKTSPASVMNDVSQALIANVSAGGSSAPHDNMRLLLCYLISQEGLKDSNRDTLLSQGNFTAEDRDKIINLSCLGVSLKKGSKGKSTKTARKVAADDGNIGRYVPPVKDIVSQHLSGTLPKPQYPYIKDPPPGEEGGGKKGAAATGRTKGGKSGKHNWANDAGAGAGSGAVEDDRMTTTPPLIVFIVGGATYSEARSIYELQKEMQRPIFLVSTGMLNAQRFIEAMKPKTENI